MIINILLMFVLGLVLGSFYCKIGTRLPLKQKIFTPSKCESCGHILKYNEKIPLLSYIFQHGKCNECHQRIPAIYPMFEFITGVLFVITYIVFKDFYNANLTILFALSFISSLLIIMVTDIRYMLIPNKLLLVSTLFTVSLKIILEVKNEVHKSFMDVGYALVIMAIYALIMFLIMYIIKKLGELIFRKDALGGGDVKMMAFVSAIVGYKLSIVIVFLGSFIALPFSIINSYKKNDALLPFGPYLAIATIILFLCNVSFDSLLEFIN